MVLSAAVAAKNLQNVKNIFLQKILSRKLKKKIFFFENSKPNYSKSRNNKNTNSGTEWLIEAVATIKLIC